MKTKIKACGALELWLLELENGVIPAYATPLSPDGSWPPAYYRFNPAITLDEQMHGAFYAAVKPIVQQRVGDYVTAGAVDFQNRFKKAPGVDPKYYLKWNGETVNERQEHEMDEPFDPAEPLEAFLRHVVNQTGVASIGTIKLVWRSIHQEALQWLVEKGKVLDLGFIKLVPLPYRRNWKQMLLAAFPKSAYAFRGNWSTDKRKNYLLSLGFTENLTNSILTSMDCETNSIRWTVDAILSKGLRQAFSDVERYRKSCLGPVKYKEHVRREIAKRSKAALESFSAWINETREPAGSLDDGRTHGTRVLVGWRPKGFVAPQHPPQGPVRVITRDDEWELTGPETPPFDGRANTRVPPLPHLLPPA